MSEYNMSHTGAELDDAINKFISGYIDKSKMVMHITKQTVTVVHMMAQANIILHGTLVLVSNML